MDLFQLETFVAVVQEGSFSRAAQRLHRTQPAVSQIIRKLERELGEALFDRSSRDGTLTDAGRVLLHNAEKLLNLRNETQRELSDLRRLQSGRISVAANEFTALYLLPVLHQFRRLHPMIQVAVRRSLASHIPQELLAHTVELGMLSYDPQEPQLRSIVVYRDELSFVVYPEHPLARLKQVRIKQLGAETFVAHNVPSPYRAKVLEAFRRHRTPLHMDVELPTIEAIKLFVARGNGVALVPRISIERELQSGELVQVAIKELKLERKLRIVYRKGAVLSHAARALLQVMRTAAAEQRGRFLFQRE
jgi:DNA-binding transcriptional LysR family regulator